MTEFKPDFVQLKQRPSCFLAFGFDSGLAPVAPDIFGTLPALPIAFVLYLLGVTGWWLAVLCVVLFFWDVRIRSHTGRELGIQDYGGIVWDEIVAMLLVLVFIPFRWKWWLAAFVLFRVLDAVRPRSVRWFDMHIHGGLGITLDDITMILFVLFVLNAVM